MGPVGFRKYSVDSVCGLHDFWLVGEGKCDAMHVKLEPRAEVRQLVNDERTMRQLAGICVGMLLNFGAWLSVGTGC